MSFLAIYLISIAICVLGYTFLYLTDRSSLTNGKTLLWVVGSLTPAVNGALVFILILFACSVVICTISESDWAKSSTFKAKK